MGAIRQQYIENNQGHKIAVLVPIEEYNRMIALLEEIEDIKAYDAAIKSDDETIPFDQAIKEIEDKRDKGILVPVHMIPCNSISRQGKK